MPLTELGPGSPTPTNAGTTQVADELITLRNPTARRLPPLPRNTRGAGRKRIPATVTASPTTPPGADQRTRTSAVNPARRTRVLRILLTLALVLLPAVVVGPAERTTTSPPFSPSRLDTPTS